MALYSFTVMASVLSDCYISISIDNIPVILHILVYVSKNDHNPINLSDTLIYPECFS